MTIYITFLQKKNVLECDQGEFGASCTETCHCVSGDVWSIYWGPVQEALLNVNQVGQEPIVKASLTIDFFLDLLICWFVFCFVLFCFVLLFVFCCLFDLFVFVFCLFVCVVVFFFLGGGLLTVAKASLMYLQVLNV